MPDAAYLIILAAIAAYCLVLTLWVHDARERHDRLRESHKALTAHVDSMRLAADKDGAA